MVSCCEITLWKKSGNGCPVHERMKRSPLRRTRFKRRRSKSLRKRLWPEFSKLIRQRDGHCLMSGTHGGPLQASHIYPKGQYPLLELFPLNVKTLCWRHHLWWHRNPIESRDWYHDTFVPTWKLQLEAVRSISLARKHMTEAEIRAEWKQYGLGA